MHQLYIYYEIVNYSIYYIIMKLILTLCILSVYTIILLIYLFIINKKQEKFMNNVNNVNNVVDNESIYKFNKKPNNWNSLCCSDKIKIYGKYLDEKYSIFVDKYLVKDYLKNINIPELYFSKLIKRLNKYDTKLNINNLPKNCVIKSNCGCGDLIIIRNNKIVKMESREKKFPNNANYYSKWLSNAIKLYNSDNKNVFENQYKYIHPEVFVEEYLGDDITDYKFWCIYGEVKMVVIDYNRFTNHKRNLYDRDFNLIKGGKLKNYDNKRVYEKPEKFDKMVEISEKLSKFFEFVRIDLYVIDGKIYFGEFTFTPGAGRAKLEPKSLDYKLGKYWK
jgi:hypothetical protein